MVQDFYATLGVSQSAFRKAAMKYHPDRNAGDAQAEQKFKEINEAYEVLSDPGKRSAYDRYGHAAFRNGHANGFGGGHGFSAASFAEVFDDIFGEFMGGRNRAPGRGADLKYSLEITLDEAFVGKKAEIRAPGSVACETCEGSGAKPGSGPTMCATCRGAGRVRIQQGLFTIDRTCPACQGEGRVISDPCTECSGQGRLRRERVLAVDVPAGIESGTRIRLAGEGDAGPRGGPEGDLYIFVTVKEHELFERDGADLYCRLPVPMTTAALGGEIEAPTIERGRVSIAIPEGVQTGKRFRVRGKGMTRLHDRGRGDMFVEIVVETPVGLTARQKELLRQFCEAGGDDCSPSSKGFFKKAKKFWSALADN
jgi:molecular chaperone DnaJ